MLLLRPLCTCLLISTAQAFGFFDSFGFGDGHEEGAQSPEEKSPNPSTGAFSALALGIPRKKSKKTL